MAGVTHVPPHGEYDLLIEEAWKCLGLQRSLDAGSVMVGFAHHTVIGVADTIIEAVQSKDIRHFMVVGGW